MISANRQTEMANVSLFTREWIEMHIIKLSFSRMPSPSLRGSGLKSVPPDNQTQSVRLPLYEGVD